MSEMDSAHMIEFYTASDVLQDVKEFLLIVENYSHSVLNIRKLL